MSKDVAAQRYELVHVEALSPHSDNPLQGNMEAIADSLEASGFYGTIVAQRSTRHVLAIACRQ